MNKFNKIGERGGTHRALNDGCRIRIKAYQKKKMLIKFQDSYCNYSHLLGIETMEAVFYFLRKETIPNFIEKNFNVFCITWILFL